MSSCHESCTSHALAAPQRNHYFYGRLLDEHSFLQEQHYLNQKRWLLNRLSLGKGVLCGLTVTWTDDRVCISSGVAIDGCGREIVVPEPVTVNPWQTTDDHGLWGTPLLPSEGTHEVYLCLAYVECPTDFTSVLVTDCDRVNGTAPSTIVERYAILVKEVAAGFPPPQPPALDKALCAALSGKDPETIRKDVCAVLAQRACADEDAMSCVPIVSKVTLAEGKIKAVEVCGARPVVYSNPELFEMLLCRGSGAPGVVGPPGPQGAPGLGIDSVTATPIDDCKADPTAAIDEKTDPKKRILRLGIPRGCEGPPGRQGPGISRVDVNSLPCEERATAKLVPDKEHEPHQILKLGIPGHCDQSLTKITGINWPHDGQMTWQQLLQGGLKIDFSNPVQVKPGHAKGWFLVSLELSGSAREIDDTDLSAVQLAGLLTMFWPKGTTLVYRIEIEDRSISGLPPAVGATGLFAQWCDDQKDKDVMEQLHQLINWVKARLGIVNLEILVRVVVKCDFLIDKQGKCVDGNHLRGSMPCGDGIGGGEFESWFQLVDDQQAPGALPSRVSARALSGKSRKREKDALDKLLPGFGSLAAFFNK